MKNIAGPSGFEPETAGCLRRVKSPVLYLAELRAQFNLSLVYGIIYLFIYANRRTLDRMNSSGEQNILIAFQKVRYVRPGSIEIAGYQ